MCLTTARAANRAGRVYPEASARERIEAKQTSSTRFECIRDLTTATSILGAARYALPRRDNPSVAVRVRPFRSAFSTAVQNGFLLCKSVISGIPGGNSGRKPGLKHQRAVAFLSGRKRRVSMSAESAGGSCR